MNAPMMKCGHSANAESNGKPCCVICAGIVEGAYEVAETPDFTGRTARCAYWRQCGHEKPSGTNLAFFEHKPSEPFDEYYCGCHGWD